MLGKILGKLKLKGDNTFPVFFICLVIAIVFWILNSLNKIYTYRFNLPLHTSNMPYSKRIGNKIPETVQVTLRARGFELLWFSIRHHSSVIAVDLNGKNTSSNKISISMMAEFSRFFGQSLTSVDVLTASPDSVHIFLSSKYQKKVPVIADLTLTIKKNYGLYDNIRITPDSVYVSGEKNAVDKILNVTTQEIKFEDLDQSTQVNLSIQSPGKDLLLSDYSTSLFIPVDEFIENKLSLPVIYKLPGGKRMLTIPEQVDVIYKVALRFYNKLPVDSFAITAYPDASMSTGRLFIKVSRYPHKATVISVVPAVVSFYIEK